MKELSKPEFTELLESAEDEELEFMAEAIVRTQKKRMVGAGGYNRTEYGSFC